MIYWIIFFFETLYFGLIHGGTAALMFSISTILTFYTAKNDYFRLNRYIPKNLILQIFFFTSFMGLIITSISLYGYGSTFAPYGDDSTYFINIKALYEGGMLYKIPTLYEFVLIPYYAFANLFVEDVTHMHLISFNWYLASLIGPLAIIFTGNFIEIKNKTTVYLCIAGLYLNSIFMDSVVNLYRDGLICVLMLIAINRGKNKIDLKTLVLVSLVFLLRAASGLILLLIVVAFNYYNKYRAVSVFKIFLRLFSLLFLVILIDNFIGLGGIMRSFFGKGGYMTLINLIESRTTTILNDSGSFSERIRSSGLIGQFLAYCITIIAPLSPQPIIANIYVSIRGMSIFLYTGITPRSFLSIFGLFNTVITGPLLIFGLIKLSYKNNKNFIIFIIYLLVVAFVTFISFQSRHRLMFYIFNPFVIAYAISNLNKKNINLIILIAMMLLGIIIIQL